MDSSDTSIYITCTRRKAQQKKHVAVCASCRRQSGCESYQAYQLEKTRKSSDVLLTLQEKPFIESDFLNDVRRELTEISLILADYGHDESIPGIIEDNETAKIENLLEYMRNELGRLKSLF